MRNSVTRPSDIETIRGHRTLFTSIPKMPPAKKVSQKKVPEGIRRSVCHLREDVWRSRDERDAYTLSSSFASSVDVDHVLEIQLASYARLDDPSVLPITREFFNGSDNLNVTSKRVNQSKKGPFTSAINRLRKRDGSLRDFSAEKFARAGRARWLVDEGIWDRIETEIVASYDGVSEKITNSRLTRAQAKKVQEGMDELHDALSRIKIL